MPFIRKKCLLIVVLLMSFTLQAQIKSIGTPFIHSYPRAVYQAGSQTWDIEQGNNGMMYFANNNGLLEYDGKYWAVYPLPNNSIIRSIKSSADSIMYAGGYNEFGYYIVGKMGGAKYHSLTHLLPDNQQNFGDVWNIFLHADGVIFQSYTQIIFLKNNTISVIPAPSSFHFSFLVDNEYYVNDLEKGLMRYAMGKLHPLIGLERLKKKEIWGIQSYKGGLLIATASEGIYTYDGNTLQSWDNKSLDFLKQNQIYSSLRLSDQLLAFGTIQHGLLICDNDGNPLQHISMSDGLQNNTILCIEKDAYGNLWLGTDLGIDYLEINSPLSQLSSNYGLSTGYTAIEYMGHLYLGTNRGLFVTNIENFKNGGITPKEMEPIEALRGQVWTLEEIDGRLFCGHNNGTFLIEGKSVEKISDIPGGWSFVPVPNDKSKIIGGNFSGIAVYHKKDNKWSLKKQLKGFAESTRKIVFDADGSLWIAHGYKGVFKLEFDTNYDSIIGVELFNEENSNLLSADVSLSKIDNKTIFTNLESTYTYSSATGKFLPYEDLNRYLKGHTIRELKEDNKGNVWYFKDNKSGVLRILEDGNYSDIGIPFQQIKDKFVKGFEFVYPLDEENIFFGAENGFIHYNPAIVKNYDYQFNTYLRTMRTFNPDSVFTSFEVGGEEIVLEYENNDLEFIFSANDFENSDQIMFSTFMEGYDKDWSEWQMRSSRDFTNLNEGDYVFKVKARNIYNTIAEEVHIKFTILPPFQRSTAAFILYGLLLLLLLFIIVWVIFKRFEKAKIKQRKEQLEGFKKIEENLQREALEAEKQVIRLRNEHLRAEMKQKDKELANSTMQTLHKNKLLITIRDELKKLSALNGDQGYAHEVKYLVRKINKEIDSENQWKIFETHFENVYEEFLKRFKTAYPDLTPRELKLCAYLRMNISSKEISVLMNISTRGVEISRYRLRKKLNLARETNLTDFILSF